MFYFIEVYMELQSSVGWVNDDESLETEVHIFVLKPAGFITPNLSHIDMKEYRHGIFIIWVQYPFTLD